MKTVEQLETELRNTLARERQLREALEGVVNHCVHPDIAVRAVMVDLKPIRAALSTPAPRVFTAEEGRPLMENLKWLADNTGGYPHQCVLEAINHARKLGMEGEQ